jgi:hypothetical protein
MTVFVKRLCTAVSCQKRGISWLVERKLTSHAVGVSDLVNICITSLFLLIERYTHVQTDMFLSKTCNAISCRCYLHITLSDIVAYVTIILTKRSGSDAVSIELGCGLHCRGTVVLLPAWIRNSPLLQRVQMECGAQPNSHVMDNGMSIFLAETNIDHLFDI